MDAISLLRLRVFVSVVDTGSFSQTAQRLHMAQPSVSMHVKALEKTFDAELITRRRGSPVQPTKAGWRVYQYARETLLRTERLADDLRDCKAAYRYRLRVAASSTFGKYRLPLWLGQFKKMYPQVLVSLHVVERSEIGPLIAEGAADVAFTLALPHRPEGCFVEHLGTEEIIVVAAPDHPVAAEAPVRLRDLAKHPFIVTFRNRLHRQLIDRFFNEAGAAYSVALELTDVEAIKRCIEGGLGISMLVSSCVERELALGTLKKIPLKDCRLSAHLYCLYPEHMKVSAAVRSLIRLVRTSVRPAPEVVAENAL